MSIKYGQTGFPIGPQNISSITITSATLTSETNVGPYGKWQFSHNNVGCGSTGFTIFINDATIPFTWTKISWKTWIGFTSSCWNFGNGGAYGVGSNNIAGWDPSSGDRIAKAFNSFELPQYAVKMNACDNNSDNFNHSSFKTGSYRHWNMVRRRGSTASPAGPTAGFACTGGGVCYISEVVVWE